MRLVSQHKKRLLTVHRIFPKLLFAVALSNRHSAFLKYSN